MYVYLLLIGLFLIDFYIFILSPFIMDKKNKQNEKRRIESIRLVKQNDIEYEYEEYPKCKLINILNSDLKSVLSIDTTCIDLKEKIFANTIELNNVKKITSFNVIASKVTFVNCNNYYEKDGCIFNSNDEIEFIYQEKNIDELTFLAKNEKVSRQALKYFTNASYIQFSKLNEEIRISKPYDETDELIWFICPIFVDKYRITKISININELDYIYIPASIEEINLEREVTYNKLINDSKYFKIRNNALVTVKSNYYVSYKSYIFRQNMTNNLDSTKYEPKYKFIKYTGMINLIKK